MEMEASRGDRDGHSKPGFLGRLGKKKDREREAEPSPEEVQRAEEDISKMQARNEWHREQNAKRNDALALDEEYVPPEMPEYLREDDYEEIQAEKEKQRRIRHERDEARSKATLGEHYIPTPYEEKVAEDDDSRPTQPPPPPEELDGSFAEELGAQAYGSGQLYRSRSGAAVGGASLAMDVRAPTQAGRVKIGWAGIFDRHNGSQPPPNPFAGPTVVPQQSFVPPTTQSRARIERGIPMHVQQQLDEGRGLATLALNNHESAPKLREQGKVGEAFEAYKAADAGYERALRILMPLRKTLQEGPDTNRPARTRESDRLAKLIPQILDHWESLKPHLVPPVPTQTADVGSNPAAAPQNDPLVDRFASTKLASTILHEPPPSTNEPVFSETGELNVSALPSVPTHQIEFGSTWDVPKTGGPKDCFICVKKRAEVMSPCEHFFCQACADQMFSLFPNQCPQCKKPCKKSDLKAIA